MTDFKPGELVDVVIRGARVMDPKPGHDHILTLGYAQTQPGVYATIDLGPAAKGQVGIERVAPAEWPPIQGDVWRDNDNLLWFVSRQHNGSGRDTRVTPSTDHGVRSGYWGTADLLRERGPLTLVHREYPESAGSDL